MSTSSASAAATHAWQRVARDPRDLFTLLILQSPERCATCHERIRDKTALDDDESHDGLGTGNRPEAVFERCGAGTIGHDAVDKDRYGAQRHHYTRTYCDECGRPSASKPDDTPDLETMLDRVPPLADTLCRAAIPHDTDALYDTVRHLKTQPDYADRTTDIWSVAVAIAVRKAEP